MNRIGLQDESGAMIVDILNLFLTAYETSMDQHGFCPVRIPVVDIYVSSLHYSVVSVTR